MRDPPHASLLQKKSHEVLHRTLSITNWFKVIIEKVMCFTITECFYMGNAGTAYEIGGTIQKWGQQRRFTSGVSQNKTELWKLLGCATVEQQTAKFLVVNRCKNQSNLQDR